MLLTIQYQHIFILGPVCFNQFAVFAIGSGGFGGKTRSNELRPLVATPSRVPDVVEMEKIGNSQAALYRLAGDLNPLHIDPSFAAMGGLFYNILLGGFGVKLHLNYKTISAFLHVEGEASVSNAKAGSETLLK